MRVLLGWSRQTSETGSMQNGGFRDKRVFEHGADTRFTAGA
jgi:hypothetical protein